MRSRLQLCLLAALALVLRLIPAFTTDLQVDEIFTVSRTARGSSVVDALRGMRDDNNHLLNTVYCFLVGTHEAWVYRVPSVLLGTATAVLVLTLGRRRNDPKPHVAALLVALSYPLVYYSAEARGYAAATFFAVASLHFFSTLHEAGGGLLQYGGFWCSCCLGVASHYSFVIVLGAYVLADLSAPVGARSEVLRRIAKAYLPVLAVVAILYVTQIRGMRLLGGPVYPKPTVALWFAAESLNLPFRSSSWLAVPGAAALVALGWYAIRRAAREDQVPLLSLTGVVAAVSVVALSRPVYLYPRYFLVLLPLVLMLVGRGISELLLGGRRSRLLGATVLVLVMTLGAARLVNLWVHGKAHYVDSLTYVLARSQGKRVVVAGTPQTGTIIEHHRETMPGASSITFACFEELEGRADSYADFAVAERWSLEHSGLDPESVSEVFVGRTRYRRCFGQSSADGVEADWVIFRGPHAP